MRAYISGDQHLQLSGPREAECRRLFDWLAEDIEGARPDVIVLAGDLYNRRATPAEERFAQSWLQGVSAKRPECNILIIRGNHDDPQQIEVLGNTRAKGRIRAFTKPGAHGCRDVNLSLVPWPSLGHLAAAMPGASIQDRREAARSALVDVLRGFRPVQAGTPSLLVAHANVLGAAQDSGQPVCGGDEIALSVSDMLESGAGAVICGHIHAGQDMRAPVPCAYTGSLFRQTFGEATGVKGSILAEWTGSAWTLTRSESPARRMLLIDVDKPADDRVITIGESDDLLAQEVRGSEVRLRVEFPSDEREAVRARMALIREHILNLGAFSVTVDERPQIVQRTRCAEIATARTTAEKVEQWAKAVGAEVPDGAAVKLAALEEEVGT